MGLTSALLPSGMLWGSWVLWGVLMLLAALYADWDQLFVEKPLQHTFFGAAVALMILWNLRAGILPGLAVHILGMTTLSLMLSWPLAIFAGSLSLIAMVLLGREALADFAVNGIVTVKLPALVTYGVMRWERTHFRIFFAYIFVCGFFGAAISAACSAIAAVLVLLAGGVYGWDTLVADYLRYLPMIMLPEAFVNGMLITGLMVYFPQRLLTLDESRYL